MLLPLKKGDVGARHGKGGRLGEGLEKSEKLVL